MTAQLKQRPSTLPGEIIEHIAATAAALDRGEQTTRNNVVSLAELDVLDLGSPGNVDGALPVMASVIRQLSGACMATAFSVWAHRMTIEYLTAGGTPWARCAVAQLKTAAALGVTGMASAFKDAAGCGSLDLVAERIDGGYALSGTLRWASNLYPDSILVTAARTGAGKKLVVALPLATAGVSIGKPFDLLALGSTASSYLTLDEARIGDDQVLSEDFESFLAGVRPTFLILQTALCLGLSRRCLDAARPGLTGVNSVFAAEFDSLATELTVAETALAAAAAATGTSAAPGKPHLLSLRLAAAGLANSAAALEIRTAGGRGYARHTDSSRRFREAAFLPVQSPSESQLRWELNSHD